MLRYIFMLLLLVPHLSPAQSGDCKQYVLDAYKQFNQRYDFGDASPSAHLKMLVETTYQPSRTYKAPPTVQQVEAERQGEYLHFTDGSTEAYQSPGQWVTIIRDKKLVAITNAVMPKQRDYVPGMMLMRNTIIETARVESCTTVNEKGRAYRRVVLIPKKLPQLKAVRKLVVTIDEKSVAIHRFAILYEAPHPTSQITYTLVEESPSTKAKRLRPAFEYVLASGASLKPEFTGFQLIDQRKR